MLSTYLADIITLLIAAVIIVPIFQILRLGAVPGFLVAGMIVGSSGWSLIDTGNDISHFSEIGVVLLLFVIGIELKPSRLWVMRRLVFGLGSMQVLVTALALTAVAYYLGTGLRAAILIGPALALSSTAFVLQLLTEKKALNSMHGRTSLGILLLQDLAVVPLLALVPLLATPELSIGKNIGIALLEAGAILALVVLLGRYCLHPILHRVALSGSSEVFTASAVLIVLGIAKLTEYVGLSMALGAFIAGLLLSNSSYRHQIMAEIQPFRGLLLGLFFMSMGMSLNIDYFFANPLLSLGMLVGLIFIKVIMLWALSYAFGLQTKNALAVALILGQSGEFAMVLFALANDAGLFTEEVFQPLLLLVLLSMLVTPALAGLSQYLLSPKDKKNDKYNKEDLDKIGNASIIIAGFSGVGQRIADILSIVGQPFVALDLDPEKVARGCANGYPVFYGDVQHPEVLKAAGLSDAKIMIITLDETDVIEKLVTFLRETRPRMNIFVRAHNLKQCSRLKKLGATVAVSENIETSLELARATLTEIGVKERNQDFILNSFRETYNAEIEEVDF